MKTSNMKDFVPPKETQTLDGRTLGALARYNAKLHTNRDRQDNISHAKELLKMADRIDIGEARLLGVSDTLVRLRRNILALRMMQDMVEDFIENINSEVNDILQASEKEHEDYLANVERLREQFKYERELARQRKVYQQNKEKEAV